jgi:rRNA maturation endonuclease Nob1
MPVINTSRMQARSAVAARPVRARFNPVQISRSAALRSVRDVTAEAKKSVGSLTKADLEVLALSCTTKHS